MFDFMTRFDFAALGKLMLAELLIGVIISTTGKYIVLLNASRSDTAQIISTSEYSSIRYGEDLPRGSFDIFKLPPTFVIVRTLSDEVKREDFYTFLGSSVSVWYRDGVYKGTSSNALSAPVYLCTVLIPFGLCVLAFVGNVFPDLGLPLLISALIWMFSAFFLVPILLLPLNVEMIIV
ncbi:MAG: hypothetical protein AAFX40_12985 [Cyanobacteria bacterium J06639_1]